jgi:hypothetical protein
MVVQNENIAPVVTVANLSVMSNEEVTVTATSTDYEGDDVSYTWKKVSGPDVDFTTDENSLSFTAPSIRGGIGQAYIVFQVSANDGTTTST